MKRAKIAKIDANSLHEMGDAVRIQSHQLNLIEEEKDEIEKEIDIISSVNRETEALSKEADKLMDDVDILLDDMEGTDLDDIVELLDDRDIEQKEVGKIPLKRVETLQTGNNWESYNKSVLTYAEKHGMDVSKDAFSMMLSQKDYDRISEEVNDEFAQKTSIRNKTDLMFLSLATALQVAKSILFSVVSEKVGYGQSFDKDLRFDHNAASVKMEEGMSKDDFIFKKLDQGNDVGEWIEILERPVPYDTVTGSKAIGYGMSGMDHRLHTLGHDPILGWIFGTSNILTDTVTFDSFATYKVARSPKLMITPEFVPFPMLANNTIIKIKEDPLNLPAAIVKERIHLQSDEFTKCGLPVPLLQTFAPDFAGNLYKNQYDVLCAARDIKVIGTSTAISLLINMIISLTHALYYNKDTDGTRDMFEVRTRKILLISNTIATTSNIIYSSVMQNPKSLDIGGLLVTISRLFTDSSFILNVKRDFIENRIYEKIEDEIKAIEDSQNRMFEFEYKTIFGK